MLSTDSDWGNEICSNIFRILIVLETHLKDLDSLFPICVFCFVFFLIVFMCSKIIW